MNKKKIEIEIDEDVYEEIHSLTTWLNINNQIIRTDKPTDYIVNDFIIGSTILRLNQLQYFKTLIKINVDDSTVVKNKFKQLAKERGIKQIDICEKLQIERSNLSAIFNNKVQPRTELFFKIWALLGCPPIHKCITFEG